MQWRRESPVETGHALPGRQAEREAFAECLARAAQGTPQLLLFEGEAGSGKSSLLQEIANSPLLPRRRIRVALVPLATDDKLDVVALAARALTRHGVYDRLGGRNRFLHSAQKVLPDWIGAIPAWGDLLEAIYTTVAVVRRRRRRGEAIDAGEDVEALLRISRRRPTAVLFDNLELADEPAVERLRKLMQLADVGTRLLVIGAFRTAPPGAPRPPVRTLADRLPANRVQRRRLAPLSAPDVDEWLAFRLPGADLPAWFRDRLLAETGGQPGALEATLEALVERGTLWNDGGRWTLDDDALGADFADAAVPELDLSRLGGDAEATVRGATMLGDRFDSGALARLLDDDELTVEDRLAVGVRSGILDVLGTATGPDGEVATVYRFSSSAVRAALQRGMPAGRRKALQEVLERVAAAAPASDPARP